jgi:hypothetical protein
MPIAFDDGRLPVQSALRERLTPATTARTSLSSHPDAIMFRPLLFAPAAPNLARRDPLRAEVRSETFPASPRATARDAERNAAFPTSSRRWLEIGIILRLGTDNLKPNGAVVEYLERVKGIEPSSSAWKAVALPLSYTRAGGQSSDVGNCSLASRMTDLCFSAMVGEVGLEPTKA